MITGDMVKFRFVLNHRDEILSAWKIGILIDYQPWEKIASVLYEGEVFRLHARYVTKAGRKDGLTLDRQ